MTLPMVFPGFGGGDYLSSAPPPPSGSYDERNQIVSVHTAKGVQIAQYTPDDQMRLGWTRERNQVSKCDLTAVGDAEIMREIVPWLHWVSVWDQHQRTLHWTGPVTSRQGDDQSLFIGANDMAAFFRYQADPLTRDWEATDPAFIAETLVASMIEQKGIHANPIARADPRTDKVNFSVIFEEGMLDATINRLANLGLVWSVVMGTPILGPASFKPVTSLGKHDFVGGSPMLVCDGADMANEIILKTTKTVARERVPIEGLHLQRIVTVDDMFSVSNTRKAARRYVESTSRVREVLTLPGNTRLHPDAPLTLDQMIPTTRVVVESYGVLTLMEIRSMEANLANGEIAKSVTLEAVDDDPPELEELQRGGGLMGGAP